MSGTPLMNKPFYTYKKLQGSQTTDEQESQVEQFYTYKKLQGSQTSMGY